MMLARYAIRGRLGGASGQLGARGAQPLARRMPVVGLQNTHLLGTRTVSTRSAAVLIARAVAYVQRGVSFGLASVVVLGGIGVIGVTGYYLSKELLLPSSETQLFHRAVKLVEKDERSVEMLGLPIRAHGESTNQRNVKTRPLATNRGLDRKGREHVIMQFHVDGSKSSGVVQFEVIDINGKLEYRYMVLDVEGQPRHFLINNEELVRPPPRSLFGIRWGPKSEK